MCPQTHSMDNLVDVVHWNSLISGHIKRGQAAQALRCFSEMQIGGYSPDAITFTSALKACGIMKHIDKGNQIYNVVMEKGLLHKDVILGTAIVDMYAKCGAMSKAEHVFHQLLAPNVVTWNALITGFTHHGHSQKALHIFQQMQNNGFVPDAITLSCALKACGDIQDVEKGKEIHKEILRRGSLAKDIVLGTALVDMYAKCGAIVKAEQIFDQLPVRNIVSWNSILGGYMQAGKSEESIHRFRQMQSEGVSPDAFTYCCMLKACGSTGAVEMGKKIHDEIIQNVSLDKDIVLSTTLIDMYAKYGELKRAEELFHKLVFRDVICWNALIAGYVQQEQVKEAFKCFKQMQNESISPTAATFISVLMVCSETGMVSRGTEVHHEIIIRGLLGIDCLLNNALLDMYSKCGTLEKAEEVLEMLPLRDIVSWNIVITGYAQQGLGEEALNCFGRMQIEGLFPDAITLICLLNACNHSGLVDEGEMYFMDITKIYGIVPVIDHHACIIDLFGRAGNFEKAMTVIMRMPFPEYLSVWDIMLGASCKWGYVQLGRLAFEQAVELDDTDISRYIIMTNIYTAASMQNDKENYVGNL